MEGQDDSGSVVKSPQPAAVFHPFHYSSFLLLIWKSSCHKSPEGHLGLSLFELKVDMAVTASYLKMVFLPTLTSGFTCILLELSHSF